MKKQMGIFLTAMMILLVMATSSMAAGWTITPLALQRSGHSYKWQVTCVSDGSALTATDLIPLMRTADPDLASLVQASLLMTMTCSPGTGAVAPDNTFVMTLQNEQNRTIYTSPTLSYTADTVGLKLSSTYKQALPVYTQLKIACDDIGTAGDTVVFIFECWLEY
jgi:hypothetical protein